MKSVPQSDTVSNEHISPIFERRGEFENNELDELHAECFGHPLFDYDWWSQVNRLSLGWVCMRLPGRLAGFVNVAWDGGLHAFLLDTLVTASLRRKGHGTRLVEEATTLARLADCRWLHVDFEPHLRTFYFKACTFQSVEAGPISLK